MTDRELEARLRAFYRTEVGGGETAPLALRRDVAAIPRTTGRLARWFGRSRGLTLLAAAALLLVGGAMAAGSGLVQLPSLVPPQPAPSLPVAVASPTAGPTSVTATSAPSPTANGLPTVAGQFDTVCDFGLASATVGWVSTNAALYRTVDLGRSWAAVQPPGWSAASNQPRSMFVDADTAYVFMPGPSPSIAVTHDGGASWHETAIDAASASTDVKFSFQTASSGSVTFIGALGGQLKTGPGRVYATADGGATWTGPRSVADVPGGPYCGHQAVETMVSVDNQPFGTLRLSQDGGVTWVNRTLPVGPAAPKAAQRSPIGLWTDGSGRIVMAIQVADAAGSCCAASLVYTSDDNGRSWQFVKNLGQMSNPIAQILSATEWVFASDRGDEVLSTVDGGATWRTTRSSSFKVNQVSFGSADVGWASIWCGGLSYVPDHPACGLKGTTPPLLQTTDGGQTWAPIGQ